MHMHVQAVYTSLREAEYRSTAFVPYWNVPLLRAIVPRQRRCTEALKIINATLDGLIQRCKDLVEEEEQEFVEEFVGQQDPSILHFLLASGDQVGPDATLCNHPTALVCATLQFSDICMFAPQQCWYQDVSLLLHVLGQGALMVLTVLPGCYPQCRSMFSSLVLAWVQISSKQLRDDLMTMLIAGHETTAAVLTWTVYCLTTHPQVVARVHKEVSCNQCFSPPPPHGSAPISQVL